MTRIPDARSPMREANHDFEAYVVELTSRLRGPARLRARVAEEIATDLESAAEKFTARGLSASAAARAAVSELGPAESVAVGFADELAIGEARRFLRLLLLTGPLVGVWWLLLLAPAGWAAHPGELISAIPILPVVAMAVAGGLLVLATTGRLIRWLPESPSRRAVLAASLVGLVCIAGDLLVLTIVAVRLVTGSGASFAGGLAVAAVVASLIRLPLVIRATRQCLLLLRR